MRLPDPSLSRACGFAGQLGDAPETAGALNNSGRCRQRARGHPQARSLLEEAMSLLRKVEDWIGVAWSLNHLGGMLLVIGLTLRSPPTDHEGADRFRRLE